MATRDGSSTEFQRGGLDTCWVNMADCIYCEAAPSIHALQEDILKALHFLGRLGLIFKALLF